MVAMEPSKGVEEGQRHVFATVRPLGAKREMATIGTTVQLQGDFGRTAEVASL